MAPHTSKEGPSVGEDTEVTVAPAPPESGDVTAMTSPITLPDTNLKPGMTLGEYRVERLIGAGGMGVVFEAVHPLIGKRAAVKILKKELCTDPGTLERFVDEARVVNQIGHPNIVDVFAFGEMPDGRSYFVMELLTGETLRVRLARGPVMLDEVVAIARPLARALVAAHGKGVVHRDLKPDNIFLAAGAEVDGAERAVVKLLDFGVAKLARSDHRLEKTATGALVGTPQYIAPEQAKGYTIDHRADIYALGGILFEMLTQRPPFVADNAMEVVAKHLMEPPVRPSTLVRNVPAELDTIIVRMLAKDPTARPTLAEVIAVLDRLRSATAVAFVPIPATAEPTQPVRKGPRINPLPFALVGAVGMAVGMFFLVRALQGKPSEPAQPVASEPAQPVETEVMSPAQQPTQEPAQPTPSPTPAPTPPPTATQQPAPPAPTPTPARPPRPTPTADPIATPSRPERPRPRPAETKPAKGHVRIIVNQPGKILIDSVPVGEGLKFEMELSPGPHKLEVEATGFVKHTSKFSIERGEKTIKRVRLVPALDPDKALLEPGGSLGERK
ncbi:MAG TPA: serine/threonine-protein kinase [Kofleriaceae bacterium]